jgi:hypothetical protein
VAVCNVTVTELTKRPSLGVIVGVLTVAGGAATLAAIGIDVPCAAVVGALSAADKPAALADLWFESAGVAWR